ncbi:MAG: hypothetical protein K2G41_00240 [Duncaniella sp.]|uniref:hypothetical protein n=1 Tax=Duncaniella sp. TaxID=2518496 RepID=UPI0023CD2811|nr:hypothetical protein [Duncaniella sp.]MDE6089107.1 hypothetical protein [Duncaniella sp.]
MKIKYIAFLRPAIGTARLCISHHIRYAGQLLDKSGVVTSCDNAFLIQIDHIITHHLTASYHTKWRQRRAYKLYKISRTCHVYYTDQSSVNE